MKAKMGFMVTATVFLFIWAAADVGAAPPNFNDLFNECPNERCGAPPSGGEGGGGGGGGPLIVAYTWGPVFSVQEDVDADGFNDIDDNCMYTPNDPSRNADGDVFGDQCDLCPNTPSLENGNIDADLELKQWREANPDVDLESMPKLEAHELLWPVWVGDACDPDKDGDQIANGVDNCPAKPNADQHDADGDGIGDPCDEDDDNDGVPNIFDNCKTDPNPGQENRDDHLEDSAKLGDLCDQDYDNDGIMELSDGGGEIDHCPNLQSTENGDADKDGVHDPCDNCPNTSNPKQTDANHNGKGDACDV